VIPFLYRHRIIGKDFFLCSLYEAQQNNRDIYAICLATNGEKGAGKPPMVSRNPSMGKGAPPLLNPRAPRSCRPDVIMRCKGEYRWKLIAKRMLFCARVKASAVLDCKKVIYKVKFPCKVRQHIAFALRNRARYAVVPPI